MLWLELPEIVLVRCKAVSIQENGDVTLVYALIPGRQSLLQQTEMWYLVASYSSQDKIQSIGTATYTKLVLPKSGRAIVSSKCGYSTPDMPQ